MKTKITPQAPRVTKSNDRWKWMAGATAFAAAATAHTQGQTAQISLVNNTFDSITGNSLTLDVTSGHAFGSLRTHTLNSKKAKADLDINGYFNLLEASLFNNRTFVNQLDNFNNKFASTQIRGTMKEKSFVLLPFTLTDPNVAGGQTNTNALLEIEAFNDSSTDETVALLSVFYPESGNTTPSLTINHRTGAITGSYTTVGTSDAGVFTTVPEPSCSSLALLAMGAGGIIARRKLKKTA